jgi:hypothetical protein
LIRLYLIIDEIGLSRSQGVSVTMKFKHGNRNGLFLLLLALLLLSSAPGTAGAAQSPASRQASWTGSMPVTAGTHQPDTIELSIRSSHTAEFRTVLSITSKQWAQWLNALEPTDEAQPLPLAYSIIELISSADATTYRWNGNGTITAESGAGKSYRMPKAMAEQLAAVIRTLQTSHYGKAADWNTANRLMPKGAVLEITDLETGLTFRGQRRAGSSHADVQPVTKADTAIMKTIYGGEWSWNRRAVLVRSPEGLVGASMHGMPHGGDGIPDNEFSGHFCIHYQGSVTHGSGHSDPAHQAMIYKATGKLEAYHNSLSPAQTAELFVIASNQKDSHLVQLLLQHASPEYNSLTKEWLDPSIKSVRRLNEPAPDGSLEGNKDTTAHVKTRVIIWRTGARPQAVWLLWNLCRNSPSDAWLIEDIRPEPTIR